MRLKGVFLFFLAAMVFWSCGTVPETKTRPNFIFILVDDMGWADLGCYGSSFHETPNIDLLAVESMRFTNAYAACPVCSPTRASIMTGKYP
ncbi:MAG: sulfatase-like hydrolase/transferase, partial [Bacteroidales bacterium]|nr:sulfatase-like hydrolase/transferase [Bacteroidales bacterium]